MAEARLKTSGTLPLNKWGRLLGSGLICLLGSMPALGQPSTATIPHYRVQGQLDWSSKTMLVNMRITLPASASRSQSPTWVLHVPINRFLALDTRGSRRPSEPLPLWDDFEITPAPNAQTPAGFSVGKLVLHHATDAAHRTLQTDWLNHPNVPVGYSTQRGLLQLTLPANSTQPSTGLRQVELTFSLQLPQRIWEGWHAGTLSIRGWLPELVNWEDGTWNPNSPAPRLGYWQIRLGVQGKKGGYALLGDGSLQPLAKGNLITQPPPPKDAPQAPPTRQPALGLTPPLQHHQQQLLNTRLHLLYPRHATDQAKHILRITSQFLAYVEQHYGWEMPPQLILAPSNAVQGSMRVLGRGLVLIPQVWWKNSALFRRLLTAEVVKTLAQLWLGERIFFRQPQGAWLRHGLSGWLAIDWIERHYGAQAGVRQGRDWLNPRYREHFYEWRVRQAIRENRTAPLNINLQTYPDAFAARVAVFHKAPLVLGMLQNVMGRQHFTQWLRRLSSASTAAQHPRVITSQYAQAEAERLHQRPLKAFFERWVYGTAQLDLALTEVAQQPHPNGIALQATLVSNQPLQGAVNVLIEEENGQTHRLAWSTQQHPTYVLQHTLTSPLARLSLDPTGLWFEAERKNNEAPRQWRFRPVFDLIRSREILVTATAIPSATVAGGNVLSWGTRLHFSDIHSLTLLLSQSQKKGCCGFVVSWALGGFLLPHLTLNLKTQAQDDVQSGEVGLLYRYPKGQHAQGSHRLAAIITYPGAGREQEVKWELTHRAQVTSHSKRAYALLQWKTEVARPKYGSSQRHTLRHDVETRQGLWLFGSWNPELLLRRATTRGDANSDIPIGGGGGLRGYPLSRALSYQEIALGRLSSQWRLWHGLEGNWLHVQAVHAGVFYEGGRGWNNAQTARSQPLRRAAGLRIELTLNAFNLNTFPLRVEVAKPIADQQYQRTQWVLFGAWLF